MAKWMVLIEVDANNSQHAHQQVMELLNKSPRPERFGVACTVCSEQSQASTSEQLLELMPIANKVGLFDASDFIRRNLDERREGGS
jgi:hypothetical protein